VSYNYNDRKVLIARLHTVLHITGIGQVGPAVDQNSGKVKGQMVLTKIPGGLHLKAGDVEVIVPNGNIISMQLAPK
jgi:hypothetical protein